MRKKAYSILAVFLIVLALSGRFKLNASAEGDDVIPQGVSIEGMDMSGKTYEEAKAEVDTYIESLRTKTLQLTDRDEIIEIPLQEIGLKAVDDSAIWHACHIGEIGNVVQRYKELTDAKTRGINIPVKYTCDESMVRQALEARIDIINREPSDASMVRKGGEFIIEESKNGRTLHMDEMVAAVQEAVAGEWDREKISVALIIDEKPPKHKSAELNCIKDKLGSYSTSFAGSSSNRVANIKVGAQKLDNYVLYPGEEFSFLNMTVPFTEENGYMMAGTYVAGKSVDGMGGGICQVSSTLYNAVLRAELTIVTRSNHMMTVGYVPLGGDATIANPDTDFVFRNDYEYPVFLEIYTYGSSLYANIYGVETRPENRTIEFVSVTEQTIEPGADVVSYDWDKPTSYSYVTQGAHKGYVAAFYKNVYIDGELSEEILINRSRYGAYPRYVTKGAKQEPEDDNEPEE